MEMRSRTGLRTATTRQARARTRRRTKPRTPLSGSLPARPSRGEKVIVSRVLTGLRADAAARPGLGAGTGVLSRHTVTLVDHKGFAKFQPVTFAVTSSNNAVTVSAFFLRGPWYRPTDVRGRGLRAVGDFLSWIGLDSLGLAVTNGDAGSGDPADRVGWSGCDSRNSGYMGAGQSQPRSHERSHGVGAGWICLD